ncbi:hypothetical protein Acsp06_40470 [Actinomycetospora sp. NBRC 106375]|nr:hypothetical protein Acsp06_40470 [Actinomycetospora sp. NBRC 106375]
MHRLAVVALVRLAEQRLGDNAHSHVPGPVQLKPLEPTPEQQTKAVDLERLQGAADTSRIALMPKMIYIRGAGLDANLRSIALPGRGAGRSSTSWR